MKHTPEPWREIGTRSYPEHDTVMQVIGGGIVGPLDVAQFFRVEDRDRALQCVNVLAGLNPKFIPELILVAEHARDYLLNASTSLSPATDRRVAALIDGVLLQLRGRSI